MYIHIYISNDINVHWIFYYTPSNLGDPHLWNPHIYPNFKSPFFSYQARHESREAAERKFVSADAGGYQAGRMIFGVFHEKIMGENMVINGGNMVMS